MIPVNEPWLGEAEVKMAAKAVASGWISGQGEYVRDFEDRWAALCGRRHGISVSSGTAALETAIHALGLPRGSEMIMPAFTMISCLAAVLRNGLVPVFVDADPRSRTEVARLLAEEGYEATVAADGEEASRLVSSWHPDLVITDLEMPRLDGQGLLRRVRQLQPGTPVIVLSAHSEAGAAAEPDGFFPKPIKVESLLAKIRDLVGR